MIDYATKTYGRSREVNHIFKMFETDRDVAMPGPRRLGKTFVLDRIVDAAPAKQWIAVKVELAGCTDTRAVFRRLCDMVGRRQTGGSKTISWLRQHLSQLGAPRSDTTGPWYQALLSLDYETWFERLVRTLNDDKAHRWALLIDELPIFLKALHDRGPEGVAQALSFMNLLSRLRDDNRRVRWLITGSIGIEPLARAGNYMGVLAKFDHFELEPLTQAQAEDFVKDLARLGRLANRSALTDAEATALVAAAGWRAAYYLDALSQKMSGSPSDDPAEAARLVEHAVERLLQPGQAASFGTWEEHIRKHYRDPDRLIAFEALAAIAAHPQGRSIDTILTSISRPELTRGQLHAVLTRLHTEGFITVQDWEGSDPVGAFRNPLLRRWWQRYPPPAQA